MERQRHKERRDKEAEALRISYMKIDAQLRMGLGENHVLYAAATAVAASQGRNHPKLADFQQCHKLGLHRRGRG